MDSASITTRLLAVEENFLQAIASKDPSVVLSFDRDWSQLQMDVEAAVRSKALSSETVALAHHTASSVSILADSYITLHSELDTVSSSFNRDFERIFGDMHLSADASPVDSASGSVDSGDFSPSAASPSFTHPPSALPSYIEPALKWLLKHLSNPYPSKEVKQRFADETGSSIERISDWFVDVRRRMGWTQLLREEFGRKRNDMIDAARTYYRGTTLPNHLHGKFVIMEDFAKAMYAAKFRPSPFTNKMTAAVKTFTPELQEQGREEKRRRKLESDAAAYPSPTSSSASSPISDPGASTSRKRSSSDSSDDEHSFRKRSRTDDGPSSEAFTMPSPPDSRQSTPSVPSRKRRLSDADTTAAKRPRIKDSTPLVVTLSETPEILADWFSSDREGNTDIFADDQLLDIKFFDPSEFDLPEEPTASPVEPVLQELRTLPQQTSELPEMLNFDIPSSIQGLFDFSDFSVDFSQPGSSAYGSFAVDSYPAPAVYEPPAFMEHFTDGHNPGYITRESVSESFGFQPIFSYDSPAVYSAFPGASNDPVFDQQQHKIQNEYTMYQATEF
ncbi:hypothetical protein DFH09DRAFT_323649 [Mycena vulgaris]|nr:hypothetical protein DFH09DRAFT_323649 [Mycena vulgaris]